MNRSELTKEQLYESVKTLVESQDQQIHLNQHKLFTLFSIAFQYLLFKSTKEKGHYVLRVENGHLAEKLAKKSKDPSTRKFIQKLLVPRRLKYGNSWFHLDFFNVSSWGNTNELPQDKIKGAIIVENTTLTPLNELQSEEEISLPPDYHITTLGEIAQQSILIAFDRKPDNFKVMRFPFIKEKVELASGVTVADGLEASLDDDKL